MGAGRTELMRSIFGQNYGVFLNGAIRVKGKQIYINSVTSAIREGLAYVPEDRKTLGLNLLDSIRMTIVSAGLSKILRGRLLDLDREFEVAEEYRHSLGIKTHNVNAGVTTLSGGNQQKVVLSKWLFTEPDILLLDEPTRGIDVGAKYEIYRLMNQFADQGKAIVFVSSELPELLGMSDRIYTVFEGSITGVLDRGEADQEKLMRMMTNTTLAKSV
jgi:putative multiple sugar transport system ATP-binding protein